MAMVVCALRAEVTTMPEFDLEFTMYRRNAWHWIKLAICAIWYGEQRIRLKQKGRDFFFQTPAP